MARKRKIDYGILVVVGILLFIGLLPASQKYFFRKKQVVFVDSQVLGEVSPKSENQVETPPEEQVLYTRFVTNRKGAEARESASESSKLISQLSFATHVEVISEHEKWLGVKVSSLYSNQNEPHERQKVFIKKSDLGKTRDLILIKDDLFVGVVYDYEHEKNNGVEEEMTDNIQDYLSIEFIEKDEFLSKKAQKKKVLVTDTYNIKKQNGEFRLPCENCENGFRTFQDGDTIYHYEGTLNFLNKYLVYCVEQQNNFYLLIDKTSGEFVKGFESHGEPIFSFDKKNVFSIAVHVDEECSTYFQYFYIDSNKIKPKFEMELLNFFPSLSDPDFFYDHNGYIYGSVSHTAGVFGDDEQNIQFIRIKVKK